MTKYPDRPSSGKPLAKTSSPKTAKTSSKKPAKTHHKTAGKAPNKTASNPPKATPATGTTLTANRSTAPDITPAGNTTAARSIPYRELHELLARFMQGKPGSNEPTHTAPSCAQVSSATTAPSHIRDSHATTSPSHTQGAPASGNTVRPAANCCGSSSTTAPDHIQAGHATTSPSNTQSAPASGSTAGPDASRSPAPDSGDSLHAFITLLRDWGDHLRFISRLDLVQASPELIATGRAFYNSFARAAEDPLSALDPQEDDIEMQLLVAYCRLQLETGLNFDRLHQLNEPIAQLCGLFFYLGYCYCVYEPHDLREDWRYSLLQDLFANEHAANKKQSNMSAGSKENGDKSEGAKAAVYKGNSGKGAKEHAANK